MQTELEIMETQNESLSKKWLVSKERIRTLGREIQRLHAALQA